MPVLMVNPGAGKIKSMINRDGATCRNNNNFECPTILNADFNLLVFHWTFAVLGKPSTNIDHSAPLRSVGWMLPNGSNRRAWTHKHTNKHTDTTKRITSPGRSIINK